MKNTSHITRYTQQKNKPRVTLSSKSQTPALSSIRWRRGLGRGGAFLLVSPLLGPLPTRSSRGEDGELDAALGSLDPPGLTSFRCNETPFWSPRPGQSTDFTVCLQTRLAPKGCSAGNHASPRNIFSHYANISEFKRI